MPPVYSTHSEKCKRFFHNCVCKNQIDCSNSIICQLFQVKFPQARIKCEGERKKEKKERERKEAGGIRTTLSSNKTLANFQKCNNDN